MKIVLWLHSALEGEVKALYNWKGIDIKPLAKSHNGITFKDQGVKHFENLTVLRGCKFLNCFYFFNKAEFQSNIFSVKIWSWIQHLSSAKVWKYIKKFQKYMNLIVHPLFTKASFQFFTNSPINQEGKIM